MGWGKAKREHKLKMMRKKHKKMTKAKLANRPKQSSKTITTQN